MGAQENAATIRSLNEAFNAHDAAKAASLCTPDSEEVYMATGQTFRGVEGIRQSFEGWYRAFPDAKTTTTNVIADDNSAVIEFTGRGTHTGPLETPMGTIPPTNRKVELAFVTVSEMRQGKVARSRRYFDTASMMQQLGLGRETAGAQSGR